MLAIRVSPTRVTYDLSSSCYELARTRSNNSPISSQAYDAYIRYGNPIYAGLTVRFESCACDVLEVTIWLDISFMHVDVYEIGSSSNGRLLVLE
jgi:hypothetical protein